MRIIVSIALLACVLSGYFCILRNCFVHSVALHFIRMSELYPAAYEALPNYHAMVFHPRYQHLWTKAQWVKWVKAQGVAA